MGSICQLTTCHSSMMCMVWCSVVWGPTPSLGEEGSGQTHIYSLCKRNAIILLFTIVRPRTKPSELEWGCNRFTIIIIQLFLLSFKQHGILPVSVSWPCGLSCNSWSHVNHGLPRKLDIVQRTT